MPDYRNFTPEELATDSSFLRWKTGTDPDARAFWNEWLRLNPDRETLVENASSLLTAINGQYEQQMEEQVQLSDVEIRAEVHRLRQALDRPQKTPVRQVWFTPVRYGMAASLLLLGLFGWYVLRPASAKQPVTYSELVARVTQPLTEVSNATDKPLVVNLPDESTIFLYPKSRISYAQPFSGIRREVYLTGKAFFEVSKNPDRPFYVYANSLVTKVLGTSFLVQTNEATRQVKVVVKTGRVSVYAQDQVSAPDQGETYALEGTLLTPNQQVVFSAGDAQLVRSVASEPVLSVKEAQKQAFTFKRTPIADVFTTLEKAYGIQIVFDTDTMQDCYLTASLADEPLFEKLNLICHTINAHYTQVDAYIVIDSKGCK